MKEGQLEVISIGAHAHLDHRFWEPDPRLLLYTFQGCRVLCGRRGRCGHFEEIILRSNEAADFNAVSLDFAHKAKPSKDAMAIALGVVYSSHGVSPTSATPHIDPPRLKAGRGPPAYSRACGCQESDALLVELDASMNASVSGLLIRLSGMGSVFRNSHRWYPPSDRSPWPTSGATCRT